MNGNNEISLNLPPVQCLISAVDFSSETSWHSAVLDHPLFMFFEKTLQVAVIYVYR
jgi:hypothetical protein